MSDKNATSNQELNQLRTNVAMLAANVLLSRTMWFRQFAENDCKDIDTECGYPIDISREVYKRKYLRDDVAARVVNLYPEECWVEDPQIYEQEDEEETEFEKAWDKLQRDHRLFAMFQRVDILSGIGRFGVLLLGLSDGKPLNQPVEGVDETGKVAEGMDLKLLYARPFDESFVKVKTWQADVTNPRYGQPVMYELTFNQDQIEGAASIIPAGGGERTPNTIPTQAQEVHWSRIIHIADNRANSDVFGLPRMQKVFNRLLDLKKIGGGSAEMFWKGGFAGLSIEAPLTDPAGNPVQLDVEATKEQLLAYQEKLQRYIALQGATAKSLAPNIADPEPHLNIHIRMICIALSCPWRVFMGSEVGQLASGQDMVAWNKRMNRRREQYLSPFVIRPTIDRLISYGVLPFPEGDEEEIQDPEDRRPSYIINWPDLNAPSDDDRASVAEKFTNSISKYVSTGCDTLVPPFAFLTTVLGYTDEEAEAMIQELEEDNKLIDSDPEAEADREIRRIEAEAQARAATAPRNGNAAQPRPRS